MKRGPENDINDLPDQEEPKRAAPITYEDFIYACENGTLEEVEQGINSLSLDIIASHPNGCQALINAAYYGQLAVVNLLLGSDEIKKKASASENWALRNATQNGNLAVVNRLLEIPAVRENATVCNNAALGIAAENGHLAIVNCLLEIPAVRENAAADNNAALHKAVNNGHLAVVERLLEIPAVRENVAAENNYALRRAVLSAHLPVVNRLLEIPAVRENATVFNNAVLGIAAENGHLAVVRRLLEIDAVREAAETDNNKARNNSNQNGFMNVLSRFLGWSVGDNEVNPIESIIEKLAQENPALKNSIEREKRNEEAKAFFFAFKAVNRRGKDKIIKPLPEKHPHLKSPLRGAALDTIKMMSMMIKNSPPPLHQPEVLSTKKLRAQ